MDLKIAALGFRSAGWFLPLPQDR